MVCKVLVVPTFGSWDTGLFLPRKKEALGCGITKLCYSVRNNGLHWAACFVITSHWWLVTDTKTKVWLEFLRAEKLPTAKPYWSVQFFGGLNPVSKGEIVICASRLFPLCVVFHMALLGVSLQPHDLEVIVLNSWVPPDAQLQVLAEPSFLTFFTFHLRLIPTGPSTSSHLGLYVSFRSVLQGSGEHAARDCQDSVWDTALKIWSLC